MKAYEPEQVPFWSLPLPGLFERLSARPDGLNSQEARIRLEEAALDRLKPKKKTLVALVLPFLPFSSILGFRPLPVSFFCAIAVVLVLYIMVAEVAKAVFYRKIKIR